jgi:hypothetical protein
VNIDCKETVNSLQNQKDLEVEGNPKPKTKTTKTEQDGRQRGQKAVSLWSFSFLVQKYALVAFFFLRVDCQVST